jgi:putative Flp pilus-assembly TadE/G-like protein
LAYAMLLHRGHRLPMHNIATYQSRTSRPAQPTSARGQVMVLICLAILTIMGLIGLVADVGSMQARKQEMQTAADSAALAAAQETNYGDSTAAGQADAASNGFTNGKNGVTVTINNPPKNGPNTGVSGYFEAIVSQPMSTYFLRALGITTITVSARAVASTGNGPDCIYILDPSASAAMNLNGNINLQMSCGLLVDSSSSSGMSVNGNVTITASSIGVVGGYLSNGNVTFTPAVKNGRRSTSLRTGAELRRLQLHLLPAQRQLWNQIQSLSDESGRLLRRDIVQRELLP